MTGPLTSRATIGNGPVLRDAANRAFSRSNVQPLYNLAATLANANNERCDILFCGDSIMEGAGASLVANRWLDKAQALLRAKYGPVQQGPGFVPPSYASGPASGNWTTGWTYSGSWIGVGQGFGFKGRQCTGAGQTATITRTCTSFDLYFRRNSTDAVTITIDGGAPITFTMNVSTGAQKWSSGPLGAGTHTIVIAWSAGGPTFSGSMFFNGDETAGVALWDGSHGGARMRDFLVSGDWTNYLGGLVSPAAVVLGCGTNDARYSSTGYTSTEYRYWTTALIKRVREKMPSVPVLLMPPYQPLGPLIEPWTSYTAALQSIAETTPYTALYDMSLSIPYLKGDPYGSLFDSVHPSTRMHALLATLAMSAIDPR